MKYRNHKNLTFTTSHLPKKEAASIFSWFFEGCHTENARIHIHTDMDSGIRHILVFKAGIFLGGTWEDGQWWDGIWHGGTWVNGYWYGGIWLKGKRLDGISYSGITIECDSHSDMAVIGNSIVLCDIMAWEGRIAYYESFTNPLIL